MTASFLVYGRRICSFSTGVILFAVLNASAITGQSLSLPLYLSTFGHYAGKKKKRGTGEREDPPLSSDKHIF